MPDEAGTERVIGAVERLVLGQIALAMILLERLIRTGPTGRTAMWIQRLDGTSWLRFFPLLHRRVPLARHAALCALAARHVPTRRRSLVQSMAFLWLVRARGHAAGLVTGLEALRD